MVFQKGVEAQKKVSSNEEIILQECLQKMNQSSLLDTLKASVYPTGNLEAHFRYKIIHFLLNRHIDVKESPGNADKLDFSVKTDNSRKKIKKGVIQRNIQGYLTVTLTDSLQNIEGMVRYPFSKTDTVSIKNISKLIGSWEPSQFNSSQHKKFHIWHRVVQPGLLISAVGVTIYLLYNVRSK